MTSELIASEHKWSTPHQDFSTFVVETAKQIFQDILAEVEHGRWNPRAVARNTDGYPCGILAEVQYFNVTGGLLLTFAKYSHYPNADAIFELIVTIIGSEASKVGYTSPRALELEKGKKGVITLLQRCATMCNAILIEDRDNRKRSWSKDAREEEKGNTSTSQGVST